MKTPNGTKLARRWFLEQCGVGLGSIALGHLLRDQGYAVGADNPLAPKKPHHEPKAKRVIYLFMAGGPSHLELFDNKPKLRELDGKPIPPSVIAGQRYAFIQPDAAVLAPREVVHRLLAGFDRVGGSFFVDHASCATGSSAASSSATGTLTVSGSSLARIFVSISAAVSGLAFRNSRTFSLPWPMRSSP